MDDAVEAIEKWEKSANAWIDGMRRGDPNRTHLLDPVMLQCLGDIKGRQVLDIGCGEGRFCRMMAEKGAFVTGVDITKTLVDEARRLDPIGRYAEAGAEDLPYTSNTFDLTVSYIVLVDVADYQMAIREMARVTRPGGRILVANVSSIASQSATGWFRDADRKKLHFPVDRYFEERALRLEWGGMSVINWHRPLQSYMVAFLKCGLVLEQFLEPAPTPEAIEELPSMIDETRIPLFNVTVWEKPKVA